MRIDQFRELRRANNARQKEWPMADPEAYTYDFALLELNGEAGELADAVKKYYREFYGLAGNVDKPSTLSHVLDELSDVVICLDLLMIKRGMRLEYIPMIETTTPTLNPDKGNNDYPVILLNAANQICEYVSYAPNAYEIIALAECMTELTGDILFNCVVEKFNATSIKLGLDTRMNYDC